MTRTIAIGLALTALAGCAVTKLNLVQDPVRMTVIQRQSKPMPGSDQRVRVSIGDVTGGQVLLSVGGTGGQRIIDTVSVEPGDVIPFTLGTSRYSLRVVELRNLLVGDDFAVLEISSAAPSSN